MGGVAPIGHSTLRSQERSVDLGYVSAGHAAQGTTVARVIINIDGARSVDLVNERQFYVSLFGYGATHDKIQNGPRKLLRRLVFFNSVSRTLIPALRSRHGNLLRSTK
jgi:hypothetical protein